MPFEFPLPARFRSARWKVKIREKETREPPHVTILRGTQAWRIDLRTGAFMDRRPDPAEVPETLVALIREEANWALLCAAWDRKYPSNPVTPSDDEDQE